MINESVNLNQKAPNIEPVTVGDFVFDPSSGTLKRGSFEDRLPAQAANVLIYLIEHASETVPRGDLHALLWPDVKVNEADHGVNNLISRLRHALGDTARSPRYIETVNKRGYRLVASVGLTAPSVPQVSRLTFEVHQNEPNKEDQSEVPDQELLTAAADSASLYRASEIAASSPQNPTPALPLRIATAMLLLLVCIALAVRLGGVNMKAETSGSVTSLAIAPFHIEGASADDGELAESLRLDLTDMLSRLPGVKVKATHSFGASASTVNIRPAELGVENVLYGTLKKRPGSYALDLELVRVKDGSHISSWHLHSSTQGLTDLSRQATDAVFLALRGSEIRAGQVGGTDDAVAYEAYLRARSHARQRTPESIRLAQEEFQRVVELDPKFSEAWAGLADTLVAWGDLYADKRAESYKSAQLAAQKATKLDSTLAEGHALLGYLAYRKDWDFVEGEAELRTAIALDSTNAIFHLWLAALLGRERRFAEARDEIGIAKADDPFWVAVYVAEITIDISQHQTSKLRQTIDNIVGIKPDWPGTYSARAWGYWASEEYAEAIKEWRHMAVMQNDQHRVAFEDRGMQMLERGGSRSYARFRYEASLENRKEGHMEAGFVPAEWAAWMGDDKLALRLMSTMVDDHDVECLDFGINPAYERLRPLRDFQLLVKRVGIPSQ